MTSENEMRAENNPEVVNLFDSQVEKIEADLVRTNRTFVNNLKAEETELYQAAALNVDSTQLNANTSLLGINQDVSSELNNSILLAGRTSSLESNSSINGGIIAETATLGENNNVGILISNQVNAEKLNTFLLVARNVEGPVETKLNTQQAALAGILAGITSGIILLLGKLLFGKK